MGKWDNWREKLAEDKLRLESRRGSKVGPGRCAECNRPDLELWRYSRSNRGEVHLCRPCKDVVFDRSFGRLDALDFAEPGGFESNRRRH